MRELQGKRKFRRIIYSKWTIILLFILLILLGHSVWGVYEKNKVATFYQDKSRDKLDELEIQKENLESNISRLQSARGVEEEIRKNFSVVKEGESVIVVVDREDDSSLNTEIQKEDKFWVRFKQIFNSDR